MDITVEGNGIPPAGMVGDYYETQLRATDANGPCQWELLSPGVLPTGLALGTQTGKITGIPGQDGTVRFTVKATDNAQAVALRDYPITIYPRLKISTEPLPSIVQGPQYDAGLQASGGALPYKWALVPGSELPAGLILDQDTGRIIGTPTSAGPARFTVQATDSAKEPHVDQADFSIMVRPRKRMRRLLDGMAGLTSRFSHIGNWVAFLALGLPAFGSVWIWFYAFATPGSHLTYLGVGMLTSLTAFLGGCLGGFLFGIPRVVSSGQMRQDTNTPEYTPSSNLAEVSDWLTKLLLGAGLVQLTRLGAPIGSLIDQVAAGLHSTAAGAGTVEAAKVMAGAMLFGYAVIGLLDGYVVTIVWYQNKITRTGNSS
jgi:Putative Ig domain